MALSTIWLAGLSEKEQDSLRQDLMAAQPALRRLIKIISDRGASTERKGYDEAEYDNSGWVFKQAFLNGRVKEDLFIVDLLQNSVPDQQ